MHRTEHFDQLLVRLLHRGDIEGERWAVFPALQLEDLEDVRDIILLLQHLLLEILLVFVLADDFAHSRHCFNKFSI